MKNIKIIAFDLQGTLSDSRFSDEFWMKLLPKLYSKSKGISLEESHNELSVFFKKVGKYDKRYYSEGFWLKSLELDIDFEKLAGMLKNKPRFYADSTKLLKSLKNKKIILISSTTKNFISVELKDNKKYFSNIYSSIDDFNIAGKPPKIYEMICKKLAVLPEEMLYVGNDKEMDIDNAKAAGLQTFYFDKNVARKKLISKLKKALK